MTNEVLRVGPGGRHMVVLRAALVAAFALALVGGCNDDETGTPDLTCGPAPSSPSPR
jgi:hypothetical protein